MIVFNGATDVGVGAAEAVRATHDGVDGVVGARSALTGPIIVGTVTGVLVWTITRMLDQIFARPRV